MIELRKILSWVICTVFLVAVISCSGSDSPSEEEEEQVEQPDPVDDGPNDDYPLSDQTNIGGWTLNAGISDEFEDASLDETKWLLQGRNGEYKSNFKGRPPSQFSTNNVRLEDGKLKLETRWEPDYNFHPQHIQILVRSMKILLQLLL